jgi:hypothetical protein
MQNIPSLVVSAVSTWDGKALGKGEKQIGGFEKGVKTLAKTLGATFGAAAMLSYGKNAVKAFAENEKSAKRLEMVLKNIGLGFDTAAIEKNLGDISAKFGYEGEVLRESFQKLVTVTGDTAKAQDLLNLSLDVAAGSGQDLLTVNQDLAGVIVGNTKGLRKYNLGLTQSELKTLDFNDAVELLTKTFAGAGTAELETYAGKMRVLKEAAGNAQEIIGKGLVDALSKLGDDNSVATLAKNMEDVADYTADVIRGIGVLIEKLKNIPGANFLDPQMIPLLPAWLEFFNSLGKVGPKPFTTPMTISGSTDYQAKIEKERAAAAAAAAKREKERLALLKKQALAEKNKLSLQKAASVFDTNRISIAAALRATYDKDTRLRLEALMAIEEDNGELALKKITELGLLQQATDAQKLAGIKTISDATLEALNKQLLDELKVINTSKMAEADKELAREEAFKKYNAALTAAGQLAAKESYSERVQIQLTEIAKLASLSNTNNAAITLGKLRESEELSMIARVAAAQKKADDARLKALQEYAAALGRIGTGGSTGGGGGGGAASSATVYTIPKNTTDFTANNPIIKKIVDDVATLGTKTTTDNFFEALTNGADIASAVRGANYQARAEQEYAAFLNNISLSNAIAQGSLMQGLESGLSLSASASGSRYAAQAARSYNITINAGAIASQDEFSTLLQDTIQKINRDGDPLFVAGNL